MALGVGCSREFDEHAGFVLEQQLAEIPEEHNRDPSELAQDQVAYCVPYRARGSVSLSR